MGGWGLTGPVRHTKRRLITLLNGLVGQFGMMTSPLVCPNWLIGLVHGNRGGCQLRGQGYRGQRVETW